MPLRVKLADLFIIALVLAVGLGGLWNNLGRAAGPEGRKYAVVYVDNKRLAELSLSDHFIYTFPFGKDKHHARLEVGGGGIRMLPLEQRLCPRGICSHTGWIYEPYESIVCLPNRIMVTIEYRGSSPEGPPVDGLTY